MSCLVSGCKCKVAYRGYCQQHHRSLLRSGAIEPAKCDPGEPERFLRASLLEETDACILWPYGVSNTYGRVILDGVGMSAPRAICLLAYGAPPFERSHAAHSCDVRLCINKGHLSWKTPKGNADDRMAHGVVHRGKAAGSSLTDAQVLDIYYDPRPQIVLTSLYGCSKGTIHNIKHGITWQWLTQHREAA